MNRIFFADDLSNSIVNYDDLLSNINKNQNILKYLKTRDASLFFQNIILALVSNEHITLLDFDFTDAEIENLIGAGHIEDTISIKNPAIVDFDMLINRIEHSTSVIDIFTSGTTGQPKKISHNVTTLTREVKKGSQFANNIWGFAYNPTHIAGIQVFFQALMNLNSIINIFNYSRDAVYDTINKYQVTNISATPTFYRMMLPVQSQVPCVNRITLGGEKSSGALYETLKQIFPNSKISNIYASTEAGSLLASNGEFFSIPKNKENKIKIEDNELFVHKSLVGESEILKLEDDWYNSGDVIEWADETRTHFKFLSRKNEMINTGGYKVNPYEVEDAIRTHPDVKEVSVYGKANSVIGTILCSDIVLKENANVVSKDITHYLNDKLQPYKIPRKINFVTNILLSRTGKAKRPDEQK